MSTTPHRPGEELDTAGRHAGLVFDTLRPRRIAWWHKGLVCEATTPDGWLLRRRNSTGNRMQVWTLRTPCWPPDGQGAAGEDQAG